MLGPKSKAPSHSILEKSSSTTNPYDNTVHVLVRGPLDKRSKPFNLRRVPASMSDLRHQAREVSLSTGMAQMHVSGPDHSRLPPCTPVPQEDPSRVPLAKIPETLVTPSPAKSAKSDPKSCVKPRYLTSCSRIEAFDPDLPYQDFKRMFEDYKSMYQESLTRTDETQQENSALRETKAKLEQERTSQLENMVAIRSESDALRHRIDDLEKRISDQKRNHEAQLEELKRAHRTDHEQQRQQHREEVERIRQEHQEELVSLRSRQQEALEYEHKQRSDLLGQISVQESLQRQQHQIEVDRRDQDLMSMRLDLDRTNETLTREREYSEGLRCQLVTAEKTTSSVESARQALDAKIAYLESGSKVQAERYEEMKQTMNEAMERARQCEDKLRTEETIRRRLHNQVQELKGNIRVFCRVRPSLINDGDVAKMRFPDTEESTEIEVRGQDEVSSLGKDTTKQHPFSFDRVFDPTATNEDVFGEISQLIQSALDGFNVCIFAYGQTGSGKTYTMSSEDGMIPRALRQIYSTSRDVKDRGWSYSMQGSFVEVYNEELRDLLAEDDRTRKHEIRHDATRCETTITDITTLSLDTQDQVESILSQAMGRRSVAATKANEHSSRSHSVFILKLRGENSITGEQSKGTLNLVDLAGSERVKNADTSGERLKETQAINKSLSCLGDVIGALGQAPAETRSSLAGRAQSPATAHIPYRNSKLTYLLQYSLGGNSKTLMFVMVAPEKKCLNETLTSLRFADKVSKTRIGVAKRVR